MEAVNGRIEVLVVVLFLLISLLLLVPTPVIARKPARKLQPETATFEIRFGSLALDIGTDIVGGPFSTVADVENWESEIVKGKGKEKIWEIEHYSVTGSFTLRDVPLDESAPDPMFGLYEYPEDSSVCDFFDVSELITISWLEHVYSKDYEYWNVALNQTDGNRNYHLIVYHGTGVYDPDSDTWTVEFDNAYAFIEWREELDQGVFHNVWKGYLTFTITIQRLSS